MKAPVILTLTCLITELSMRNNGIPSGHLVQYLAKQMMGTSNFRKTSGHRRAEKMDPFACLEKWGIGNPLWVPL